ncbi:MAG: AMP-binding protein, partial [Arenicella sp.]|nr:AMP-binding protein [Arenicella sp.]
MGRFTLWWEASVVPHWVVRSFNDFYALLLEQKITVLNQTPSAFQQLIKLDQNSQLGRSLRLIIFGGEKLNPSQLLPWVVRYGCEMPQLINMYGITETTVHVTYKALNQDDVDNSVSVIGNTLDDLESLVLDDHNQLLPLGSIGELHIGGAGLARGYLHREALTAEKFIANPFHQSQAARLYKTGDLVRYLPDGSLEFIGRKDDQIKVRGFRIELGEVESSLLRLTDIRDAVVVARDQPVRLVAYVVAESEQIENESLFIDACRSTLKATLPDYMLPSLFMLLAEMPLTANGKVDFKSLPSPDASQSLRAFKAPSTKTERVLCGLWQPLLGVERIGVTDNFFELGGHSLLAMQAVSGLQKMGLAVEVRDLFTASNLAELALIIDEKIDVKSFIVPANQIVDQVTDVTVEMLPLLGLISDRKLRQSDLDTVISKVPGGRKNIQDIYPLSPTQEGVFYHHVMSQEVDPYLLADLFVADSTQQFEQFMQALRFIFERHDALRTSIFWRALPLPLQVVSLEVEIPVEWIELEPGEDVRAHMQSLSLSGCRSIDLEKGPLFRLEIAKDERSDKHYVLIRHHHILSDNYSIRVMLRDIMAYQKGRANQLPSPRAYRDFVAQSLYQSSHNNASVYFDAMLSSVDQGTLAFGLSDVNGDGTRVDELTESVPDDVSNRIRLLARELKMSPAVLFHGAWSLLLSACSGRDDVVFGTVFSGRLNAAQNMDNTFGMFINTLPMRIRLSDFTAPSLLAHVNTELRGLLLYEQTPLALAQSCSGIPSGSPLFNAVLNYRLSITDDDIGKELIDSGAIMGVRGIDFHERTNYPIGLSIDDLGDRFDLVAQVDRSLGPQRIINYMQVAIEGLLAALESNSNQNASEISVLPAAEVEYLVNTLNDTDSEYPVDQCIHQLFEQQVELNPDAVALVFEQQVFEQQLFEQQELSYAELNARANQLAHYLRSQAVKPGSLVGLCVERSLEMVIAILAILKAGGAYVPLDPSYPESRLRYMLSDSNVELLLTEAQWVSVLPEGNHRLLILNDDDEKAIIASKPTSNLVKAEQGLRSDNLAYVIYTSGSTGQPKGVLIEHRSTVALISWSLSVYSKEELTNVAFSTSVCFDLSVYEMFVPLCSGNKVTIIKSLLAATVHKAPSQVTLLNTVPSAAGMLIQQEALPTKLKVINLAGEALKQDLVDTLYDCNIDKVYDLYGPSEDTTYSTFIQRSYRGRASIGKPISNTQVYVVGERMQLLPQGVIGELHIGGAGLARGYLNRPELS